jgi:hypothetical protein
MPDPRTKPPPNPAPPQGVDPNVKRICDTLEKIAREFNTAIVEASKNIRWGLEGRPGKQQGRNRNRSRNQDSGPLAPGLR